MRVGIVVDGQAESQVLPPFFNTIRIAHVQVVAVLYANMQPKASPAQIIRAMLSRVTILQAKQVEQILLLIDREDRTECPGDWAQVLEREAIRQGVELKVVVKNRKLENWLIADPEALRQMPARFQVTQAFIQSVSPDKADHVTDAVKTLNNLCKGKRAYHKLDDAKKIAERLNPDNVADNSRSFRRLLRLLAHPLYHSHSRCQNESGEIK